MNIPFTKMHGCGNDFIVIDQRLNWLKESEISSMVAALCRRKYSVGADGVMLLDNSHVADFRMRYFNADGTKGEMCGNGARCIAKYAYRKGLASREITFETMDGVYKASVWSEQKVQVMFPSICLDSFHYDRSSMEGLHAAIVGVPHAVLFQHHINELDQATFLETAREIRYNEALFPNGTNVNIVEVTDLHQLSIRTYERGVEEETYACGSGATASAIFATLRGKTEPPVHVQTKGGVLEIDFSMTNNTVEKITLTGPAEIVYEGRLEVNV